MTNMVALTSAQLVALTATPLKATADFSQAAEVAANGVLVLAGKLAAWWLYYQCHCAEANDHVGG